MDALPPAPPALSAARRRAHAAVLAARLGVDVALEDSSAHADTAAEVCGSLLPPPPPPLQHISH
jgi:hypothetical protein